MIGQRIKTIREGRRMLQRDLAAKMVVSTSYVCMVERGQRQPNMTMIARFATALGTTPAKLSNVNAAIVIHTNTSIDIEEPQP